MKRDAETTHYWHMLDWRDVLSWERFTTIQRLIKNGFVVFACDCQ